MNAFIKIAASAAAILFAVVFIGACKNDDDPVVTTADISISSPAEGATFDNGAAVQINATIATEGELHGYEVYIRKKSDNSVVFSADEHAHGKNLTISEQWVNNVSSHSDMELEVVAILSHEGDITVNKKVNFHCHP